MKELKTYKVDFTFPEGMGFYHLDNRFYLGGGHIHPKYFAHFKSILANGEVTHLQKMPTPKASFAMTL